MLLLKETDKSMLPKILLNYFILFITYFVARVCILQGVFFFFPPPNSRTTLGITLNLHYEKHMIRITKQTIKNFIARLMEKMLQHKCKSFGK